MAVLDELGIERAHVVGMSMGGTLVQLLLLDFPDRLLSATLFATVVLEGAGPDSAPEPFTDLDPRLLALWEHLADPRDREAEIDFRVEHWRVLNGDQLTFDEGEFRRLEERIIDHADRHDNPAAHARADQSGLDRGPELATVEIPTIVVEAPNDPINPPPAAQRIADAIPTARLVTIPGMGHALSHPVLGPLSDAILTKEGVAGAIGVDHGRGLGLDVMPAVTVERDRTLRSQRADHQPLAGGEDARHQLTRVTDRVAAQEHVVRRGEERLVEVRLAVVVVQIGPDCRPARSGRADRVERSGRQVEHDVVGVIDGGPRLTRQRPVGARRYGQVDRHPLAARHEVQVRWRGGRPHPQRVPGGPSGVAGAVSGGFGRHRGGRPLLRRSQPAGSAVVVGRVLADAE